MNRAIASYELDCDTELRILRKLLLYWDGQWFLKMVETYGLDAGIALNAKVRVAFGQIEMRTLLNAVGKEQANDLGDAVRLINTCAKLLMGVGFQAEFRRLDSICADILVRRCAVWGMARRASLARVDQACVACESLWNAWFQVLLPDTAFNIQYPMRMGKGDPHCHFVIRALE